MILKVWYPYTAFRSAPVIHVGVESFSAKNSGKLYWRQNDEIREIDASVRFELFTDDYEFICGHDGPREWSAAA